MKSIDDAIKDDHVSGIKTIQTMIHDVYSLTSAPLKGLYSHRTAIAKGLWNFSKGTVNFGYGMVLEFFQAFAIPTVYRLKTEKKIGLVKDKRDSISNGYGAAALLDVGIAYVAIVIPTICLTFYPETFDPLSKENILRLAFSSPEASMISYGLAKIGTNVLSYAYECTRAWYYNAQGRCRNP
ncbi:hypothetical protein C4573_05470 [Candidatus Woesearchaeota archaeon]|nr:MAG: hypothetical protein C4573_05470 [Candidatus Woesearchaeota archaeon]